MKTASLVIAFVLASEIPCLGNGIHLSDSCRKPYPVESLTLSCGIHYDSCSTTNPMDKKFWYSKKGYTIIIKHLGALNLPTYPSDTTIFVSWQQIDTTLHSVREGFQHLEDLAGGFVMRKLNPDDSLEYQFELVFDHYCSVDSVNDILQTIPDVAISQLPWLDLTHRIPNDIGLKPGASWSSIFNDQSTSTFWGQGLHRLGVAYHIYLLQVPMAWEISRGKNSVVINAMDDARGNPFTNHPDLSNNFKVISVLGDGTRTTGTPTDEHSIQVIGCAIAEGENVSALVSSCYNCNGIFTNRGNVDPWRIDVDGVKNQQLKLPDVVTISANGPKYDQIKTTIDNGIVVLAAAGNGLWDYSNSCGGDSYSLKGPAKTDANGVYYELFPKSWGVADYVYADTRDNPSLPAKDYKVISVGGTIDGSKALDGNCNDWVRPGISPEPYIRKDDAEEFHPFFTYAPYPNFKFDQSSLEKTRLYNKKFSYFDVVAPADILLLATEKVKKYEIAGGTSFAAPTIASIVGIMMSVRSKMGVDLDLNDDGKTDNGVEVQRTVYNTLTFTSDKLQDYNNIPTNFFIPRNEHSACTTNIEQTFRYKLATKNYDNSDIQFNYVVQTNDPLNRSWAQRMGFGRVNAYRAVAHSIKNKGSYEYGSSVSLNWQTGEGNVNEDGRKLMHFGAWKNATELVLEKGGNVFGSEPAWKNNNGKTVLSGSAAVELEVPDNCILAIDGILSGTGAGSHKIYSSAHLLEGNDHGKILISGYDDNVTLEGRIKAGELLVTSAAENGAGLIFKSHGTFSHTTEAEIAWNMSEIYGVVTLQNNGLFIVDQNAFCRMQPGGEVRMDGAKDVEIRSGATLEMQPASAIHGSSTRKVLVKSGGTLRIKSNRWSGADITTEVVVEDGGALVLEDDAYLKIDRFTVQAGGTLECKPGSRLAIQSQYAAGYNICNGHLNIHGTPEIPQPPPALPIPAKPVIITGRITNQCLNNDAGNAIYMTGNLAQSSKYSLRIYDAEFQNVKVFATDIPVPEPIHHAIFSRERCLPNPATGAPAFQLMINYTSALVSPALRSVAVEHCTFKGTHQLCGSTPPNLGAYYVNLWTYESGLRLLNCSQATIKSCSTSYVEYGVITENVQDISVTGCHFETTFCGHFDWASKVTTCDNTLLFVPYGMFFETSLRPRVFNNTMTKTAFAVSGEGTPNVYLRGNTFNEFLFGADVRNGVANMGHRYVYNNPADAPSEIFGRNKFIVSDPATVTPYPNPFIPPANFPLITDVWIHDATAQVWASCGYNDFAQFTTNHFNGTETTRAIGDLTNNNFRPSATVRRPSGWTHTGGNLNVFLPPINECLPHSQNLCEECRLGPVPGETYGVGGNNEQRMAMNANADAPLWSREQLFDDYEQAMNKGADGLRQFAAEMQTKRALTPNGNEQALTYLLEGFAAEQYDSVLAATAAYSAICSAYPASPDSLSAAWKLHFLRTNKATTGDTVTGLDYYERVMRDLLRRRPQGAPPQQVVSGVADGFGMAEPLTLEQNIPNPFADETNIVFNVAAPCAVTLSVFNTFGQVVATLVQGSVGAGKHTIPFNTAGLPQGLYTYRLEGCGRILSKQMMLMR